MSEIESAALDEMFSQGEAVLAGVDLDSGALFALEVCEHRDAQSWGDVLEQGRSQGLNLSVVVKDAAAGIAAGVREVFPEAEQRDDCFHALYEMNKVRRCLERRAYGAIGREIEALSRLGTIRAHHIERRREAKRALSTAQRQCAETIERFDVFDAAMAQLRGAIECVDVLTGELHRPEQVEALIEQAANTLDTLDVRECPKLAKYLRNRAPGLALAQASLLPKLEALGEHYSLEAVGLGCVVWQLVKGLKKHPHQARRRELHRHLLGRLWEAAKPSRCTRRRCPARCGGRVTDTSSPRFERHRGIQCGIATVPLRSQGCHPGLSRAVPRVLQPAHPALGRHKGTSAQQCLTGERVDDWLTVLGYPLSPTLS